MGISEIFDIALPFVYMLVFAVIVWFVVELILLIRKTRNTVESVHKQIEPTLDHVEKITAELQPVVAKIDPLVDRASLTVDAANLEIMRLDQILEDVAEITDAVSSATNAVDTIANAPMEFVTNVTSRVRKAFTLASASSESVELGKQKSAAAVPGATPGAASALTEESGQQKETSATHATPAATGVPEDTTPKHAK